jgi:hypothetical protein
MKSLAGRSFIPLHGMREASPISIKPRKVRMT